jgi:hypothetical protein
LTCGKKLLSWSSILIVVIGTGTDGLAAALAAAGPWMNVTGNMANTWRPNAET